MYIWKHGKVKGEKLFTFWISSFYYSKGRWEQAK